MAAVFVALMFVPLSNLHAETIQEALGKMLSNHDRILAAKADLTASENRMDETFANSWMPTLDITTHYGHERRMQKAVGTDTDMESRELDLTLTQRVWDWGQAFSDMEAGRFQQKQMVEAMDLARQTLVLDAVTSYYNLDRTTKMVGFARKSADNIKRQGEVEDIRVSLGRGYSADVLQVKTQLAGAQARLVQAKGALLLAKNHIKSVFLRPVDEVASLEVPEPQYDMMPKTVEEVVERAIESNPQAKQMAYMADMLKSQGDSLFKSTF